MNITNKKKEASSSGASMGRAVPPTVRENNQAWVPASPAQCPRLKRQLWLFNRRVPLGAIINPERGERVMRKAVLARSEPATWITNT